MFIISGPAKCPKCRNNIRETIPNKGIDTAISDCLTNIKDASTTCLSHVAPTITPNVTESQDISFWSTRYDENEADIKSKNKPPQASTSSSAPAIGMPQRLPQFPPPILNRNNNLINVINEEDEDDDDDDDEEDDEEEEEESNFDGSAAYVEYARSGRSRCIMCNLAIGNRELRIAVSERYEYHDEIPRYLHVACIRRFNEMVATHQRIVPSRFTFYGIQANDVRNLRNTLGLRS